MRPPSSILHPSTILVTGGCGFIGSNLVRLLVLEKGCKVVNLDKLTYAGNPASLNDLEGHPNYHFEQVDLGAVCGGNDEARSTKHENEDSSSVLRPSSSNGAAVSPSSQKSLKTIFEQYQPNAVMHLAAESHVDRSIDGPGDFIQTNIVGTFNLLQAAFTYWKGLPDASELSGSGQAAVESLSREELEPVNEPESADGTTRPLNHLTHTQQAHSTTQRLNNLTRESFRFLHVSTDEVYGSLAPDAPGFSETTAYDPHSPYSASKAASDHLARAWGDTYGLPVLVTNCSNNYGPYQFPEKLIPVVILKCLRGESIPVYGKGENIRDWLYVEDHAEALYTVLTKGRVGETYNIGGNNERQNIELVRMLCRILDDELDVKDEGRMIKDEDPSSVLRSSSSHKSFEELITFVTDRPGHDMRYAIDASKIRDELGWEPKEDFESGFRKTVKWYLDNEDWWKNILDGSYQMDRLGNIVSSEATRPDAKQSGTK